MALPWHSAGTFTRTAGLYSALSKQAKLLNLKPVKKIDFSLDPLSKKSVVVRHLMNYFYQDRVRETNPKCVVKTKVQCDGSLPYLSVSLVDGRTLVFHAEHLESLEVLTKFNELVSSLVKEDSAAAAPVKQTKSQKRRR